MTSNHSAKLVCVVLLALFAFACLQLTNSQCNICSALNNLACVSENQYQFCIDGTPTGAVSICPDGYVCSTIDAVICQPNSTDAIVACGSCNVCDAGGIFACTGAQTYALCLGSATPSNLTGTCAPNFFCNIELPQICGNAALGVQPTCPTAGGGSVETTTILPATTTVSPTTSTRQYCSNVGQYGRFPIANSANSSCRQYVFCALASGNWTGQVYTCPGKTYFNSTSRLCGNEIPQNCTANATVNG